MNFFGPWNSRQSGKAKPALPTSTSHRADGAASHAKNPDFRERIEAMERDGRKYDGQFFIGTDPQHAGYPLFAKTGGLKHHGYVLGSPGSGKTATVLTPLLTQLARLPEKPPILVMDFKSAGDDYFREAAKAIADERKTPFRYFTNNTDFESIRFDPFHELRDITDPQRLAEFFINAFGGVYPAGYGTDFFTNEQLALLYQVMFVENPPRTYSDLIRAVQRALYKDKKQDARGLLGMLQRINYTAHVHTGADKETPEIIDFRRFYTESEILFCQFTSRTSEPLCRDLGRLILYSLEQASGWAKQNKKRKQCYVIIDEFQCLALDNVVRFLNDIRSSEISIILAHQTAGGLPPGLFSQIWANTAFHAVLSYSEPIVVEQLQMHFPQREIIEQTETLSKQSSTNTQTGYSSLLKTSLGLTSEAAGQGTSQSLSLTRKLVDGLDVSYRAWLSSEPNRALFYLKPECISPLTPTSGFVIPVLTPFCHTHEQYDDMNGRTPPVNPNSNDRAFYRKGTEPFGKSKPHERHKKQQGPSQSPEQDIAPTDVDKTPVPPELAAAIRRVAEHGAARDTMATHAKGQKAAKQQKKKTP